jgi:hypothetical protein
MGRQAEMDDDKLLTLVLEHIEERQVDPYSLDGLSDVEADLVAAVTAKGVIDNGGHDFWYQGKDRVQTLRAVVAFERMGLEDAARALRESLSAFPQGGPPSDLVARGRYITQHRAALKQAFRPLDVVVWESRFDEAAVAYIRARRTDLLKTLPELAPHLSVQ